MQRPGQAQQPTHLHVQEGVCQAGALHHDLGLLVHLLGSVRVAAEELHQHLRLLWRHVRGDLHGDLR